MSAPSRAPFVAPLLPDNAPFNDEQRAWLNGFLAAVLSPGASPAQALTAADLQALFAVPQIPGAPADPLADGDDGEAPWHDPSLPLADRLKLADGRPLRRRMMAAMAQQDCGQCGYTCENYSNAIFTGAETKLNLCVPGGKETARDGQEARRRVGERPCRGTECGRPGGGQSGRERRGAEGLLTR